MIDNPLVKSTYSRFVKGKHNVYIADLMPTLFWTDAMVVISQKILGGTLKGSDSGALADEITRKWKKQNPDEVGRCMTWEGPKAA